MSDTTAIRSQQIHQPFPAETGTTTPECAREYRLKRTFFNSPLFANTRLAFWGEAHSYLVDFVTQPKTNESATDSEPPVQIEIDLSNMESITTLGLKSEQREMDTPAYQEKKSFTGYKLADVLNTMHPDLKNLKNPDQYKVTFVCSDGYEAVAATTNGVTPLSTILSGNDFVATGIGETGKWDVVNEGGLSGQNVTPAPLYIMGDSIMTETWPLMVVKVVIEKME